MAVPSYDVETGLPTYTLDAVTAFPVPAYCPPCSECGGCLQTVEEVCGHCGGDTVNCPGPLSTTTNIWRVDSSNFDAALASRDACFDCGSGWSFSYSFDALRHTALFDGSFFYLTQDESDACKWEAVVGTITVTMYRNSTNCDQTSDPDDLDPADLECSWDGPVRITLIREVSTWSLAIWGPSLQPTPRQLAVKPECNQDINLFLFAGLISATGTDCGDPITFPDNQHSSLSCDDDFVVGAFGGGPITATPCPHDDSSGVKCVYPGCPDPFCCTPHKLLVTLSGFVKCPDIPSGFDWPAGCYPQGDATMVDDTRSVDGAYVLTNNPDGDLCAFSGTFKGTFASHTMYWKASGFHSSFGGDYVCGGGRDEFNFYDDLVYDEMYIRVRRESTEWTVQEVRLTMTDLSNTSIGNRNPFFDPVPRSDSCTVSMWVIGGDVGSEGVFDSEGNWIGFGQDIDTGVHCETARSNCRQIAHGKIIKPPNLHFVANGEPACGFGQGPPLGQFRPTGCVSWSRLSPNLKAALSVVTDGSSKGNVTVEPCG